MSSSRAMDSLLALGELPRELGCQMIMVTKVTLSQQFLDFLFVLTMNKKTWTRSRENIHLLWNLRVLRVGRIPRDMTVWPSLDGHYGGLYYEFSSFELITS